MNKLINVFLAFALFVFALSIILNTSHELGSFSVPEAVNNFTASDEKKSAQPLIIPTILPTPQATQLSPPAPALPTFAPTPTRRIEQPQPQTANGETFNCMPITDLQVFLECHFYLPPGCEVRAIASYAGGPVIFTKQDAIARWGLTPPYNGIFVANGVNEMWLSNCHLTQIQRDRNLNLGQ